MSDLRVQASGMDRNDRELAQALQTVRRLARFLQKQDPAGRALINLELRNLREVRHG